MRRITRIVLGTAALVVALAAAADAGGTWRGTLTVVGNGPDPGSVSAQGRNFVMAYCTSGQPTGTARVVANTPGTVTVAVSPSSGACTQFPRPLPLPNGTYDIRWEPGAWDPNNPGTNECGGGTDIGDIAVVNGSGGPTTSNSFNPGDPGTIQICVTNANSTFSMQVPVSVVAATPPTTSPDDPCEDAESGSGPLHHIATDKNWKSAARGGPWSPRFDEIFKNADLDLSREPANIRGIPGHQGPHPEAYHDIVLDRLRGAVEGLAPRTPEYKQAVLDELNQLAQELSTPGNLLNEMVQDPAYEC